MRPSLCIFSDWFSAVCYAFNSASFPQLCSVLRSGISPMETSWLKLTLCQVMLPSQAWSRLAQAGVMGLVLGLPRLPDTSHWQIIETAAAGGDGGLVMAAVHSGGSILYSPLSVVTLTIITQLININHSSGVMFNQEQMNIPSWPGFGLITFNSTIRCYIWSVSPADIYQSPSSSPRWW